MLKKLILAAILAGMALSWNSPAFAYRRGRGYGWGYGGWGYGGYGFGAGTTPAGSFLAGSAMLTQAAGQYNYYTSMAAQNYQQAYSQWIDNQKLRTETYFAMRRMNASYRAEMEAQHPHPTSDQIAAFNKARDPGRLTKEQFDPVTAVLNWPPTLREPEFADLRGTLENLFAERLGDPTHAGLGTQNYRAIVRAVDDMNELLHKKIREIHPDEFIAAHKFLTGLGYEARFAPETHVVSSK
jgi:hypothetical protein